MESFLKKMGLMKQDAPSIQEVAKPKPSKPIPVQTTVIAPVVNTGGVQPKHDYRKLLEDELKKRNLPGPDYLEFSEAMNKIVADTSMSEQQKFKTIFLSFEAMGIDSQKLLSSANQYLGNLNEYSNVFNLSMQNEKKAGITDIEDKIKADEARLEELTKSIQVRKDELLQNRIVLAVEEEAFKNAYESKLQKISEDIEKIGKYLVNEPK